MSTKRNIKDLLDKFIRDDITRDELDFLYHSINHNFHADDLKAWFYKNWDEAPAKNNHFQSGELFRKITSQINTHSSSNLMDLGPTHKDITMKILRYAAVLVIGFLLSWYLRNLYSNHENQHEMILNEISIPLGSKSKITLSDGTQVWLNSGSTMKYPGRFKEKRRDIFLEGEAYFDVIRDESRPFYVTTSEIHIKVLGTQFNVKSYPDENTIETTLVSGSIEIEAKQEGQQQKKQLRLSPNQKATFLKSTSQLSLQDIPDPEKQKPEVIGTIEIDNQINTEIITSWKDNKLVFSRERFEDIATRLERWYNIQIILEDDLVKNFRYTGTFENETLEQALNALSIASPFEYTIDKNTIIINSKK